jgi:hypothetical protein
MPPGHQRTTPIPVAHVAAPPITADRPDYHYHQI